MTEVFKKGKIGSLIGSQLNSRSGALNYVLDDIYNSIGEPGKRHAELLARFYFMYFSPMKKPPAFSVLTFIKKYQGYIKVSNFINANSGDLIKSDAEDKREQKVIDLMIMLDFQKLFFPDNYVAESKRVHLITEFNALK